MSQNVKKCAIVVGVLAVCTLMAVPLSAQAGVPYSSACNVELTQQLNTCNFASVPRNKRLVIQEFDASGVVLTGMRPLSLFINNTASGSASFTYTYLSSDGGFDYLATNQPTTVYVDGGSTPTCNVLVPSNPSGQYGCGINGILVNP